MVILINLVDVYKDGMLDQAQLETAPDLDLIALKESVEEDLEIAQNKVTEMKAHLAKTGEYSDPVVYQSAVQTRRRARHWKQIIQAILGKRRRARTKEHREDKSEQLLRAMRVVLNREAYAAVILKAEEFLGYTLQ